MTYLLDANVFIQAKNLQYGFDFCPAFWDWIDARVGDGTVASIERVLDELRAGGDELTDWAVARVSMFAAPAAHDLDSLRVVSDWADNAGYEAGAVSAFLQVADYYLIAQARAGGHTVVTHEVVDNAVKRIKIPNACIKLGIRCVTPYDMLRAERARFVLGA